ncbi:MAG TPA: hypothetical protein VH186_14825 [Chloroflexia bacterium]|nr:hypothetical protein [Chloroflexia bacterium]
MQLLADLLNSEQGLAFLASRGVFCNRAEFNAALADPVRFDLSKLLDLKSSKPVCSGQQVYVDYQASVLAKVVVLQQLQNEKEIAPFFIWHDTDRSGSDPLITKFEWPMNQKSYPLKIAPPAQGEVETRFVSLQPDLVLKVLETLKNYLFQSKLPDKKLVSERFEAFKEVFLNYREASLSNFNFEVTNFLLERQFGWKPASVLLSFVVDNGVLNEEINYALNNLAGFVRVYNAAIEDLLKRDIDPQVRLLNEDYLPLYYSCEVDGRRLRMNHQITKNSHYAVAKCKCNREYHFYLGQKSLSLDELAQTGRWSPDVTLPVFLNRHVSGFIMGKSSALYGLVMKEILAKVFEQKPVPFLVPAALKQSPKDPPEFDSLIYSYLVGKEIQLGT